MENSYKSIIFKEMKNAILVITVLFLFGCTPKATKELNVKENVNEEVEVILNTFENGIVWVSENDFEEMHAEIHHLPYKKNKRLRKYTITDSLLSMNDFKFFNNQKNKKEIKNTIAYPFKVTKKQTPNGFEIIKEKIALAIKDRNYNGHLTFSRVIFNKKRDRAKYYFEQTKFVSVRSSWGMGACIYAQKVNGIWMFDKKEDTWIT